MTIHPHHSDEHAQAPLPPELAEISAALDRLALHEQRSAGPGFEDRLMLATAGAIGTGLPADLAAAAAVADSLALADREGAGPALEDRIFMATRGLLRPAARPAPVVVRRVALWWARPVAAAAAAALAIGVTAWIALRPATPQPGFPDRVATTRTGSAGEATPELMTELDQLEYLSFSFGSGTADRIEDLSAELEALTQNVSGDWFQLGQLLHEEAM